MASPARLVTTSEFMGAIGKDWPLQGNRSHPLSRHASHNRIIVDGADPDKPLLILNVFILLVSQFTMVNGVLQPEALMLVSRIVSGIGGIDVTFPGWKNYPFGQLGT